MDLDRFKVVNDTFGHEAGDTVLVEVCKSRVRAELRQIDMLSRWGREEFVILLPHSELEEACQLAEAIRMRVEVHLFAVVGRLTASFGLLRNTSKTRWIAR
jgi:diguanylate cyclase (GGDEF)-like protein